jgi:hypothetical protein
VVDSGVCKCAGRMLFEQSINWMVMVMITLFCGWSGLLQEQIDHRFCAIAILRSFRERRTLL